MADPIDARVDLVFSRQPATEASIELVFGAGDETRADAEVTLDAALPALAGAFQVATVEKFEIDSALPGLAGAIGMAYISNTARPTVGRLCQPWQVAEHGESGTIAAHAGALQQSIPAAAEWEEARAVPAAAASGWQDAERRERTDRAVRHRDAAQLSARPWRGRWQDADHSARPARRTRFQDGRRNHPPGTASRWQAAARDRRNATTTRWDGGLRRSLRYAGAVETGLQLSQWWRGRHQDAMRPPAGRWMPPVIPPAEPCYLPSPHLLFDALWDGSAHLVFRCDHVRPQPGETVIVPIRRIYMVLNNVSLRRVDGNFELPVKTLTLNIDMDSWTWGFNATMPASTLPLLEPGGPGDPTVLEAKINGTAYRLLTESIQRDRTFGKSTITISGRGRSSVLADPYSPILTFGSDRERTAQQLMADALTVNGVSLGWGIDWRIDDWTVPAGAWNHQGSYMSAVNAIAAAGGAFVQPDPVAQILRVLPRYPAAPWEWGAVAPDFELPAAVVAREGIVWTEKPGYNAVYISGTTTGGILGHVKRAGSAGDKMAPMIVDPLMAHAAAVRQRAIPVLADTGRGALYSLSMPVLEETGVIEPGRLVRYLDNGNLTTGVVKSVAVNVTLPSVRQTLEVQTHG